MVSDDDIASNNRCEREFLEINKGYDTVGSNIIEFIDRVDNIVTTRMVPNKHDDIIKFLKRENALIIRVLCIEEVCLKRVEP